MTHYCSYEEMSGWAGSCRGECRTEHLTLPDSCVLSPPSLKEVQSCRPQIRALLCPFAARSWRVCCPGSGALSVHRGTPSPSEAQRDTESLRGTEGH